MAYRFIGEATRDASGFSVTAGDFTGDGVNDLLIGAINAEDSGGGTILGSAYLIASTDLAALDLADGTTDFVIDLEYIAAGSSSFQIIGDSEDETGFAVALSDVDGDGQADVLIGAPGGDGGGANSGEAYVLNADALSAADSADSSTDGVISLSNIAAQTGSYQINGSAAGDGEVAVGLHISVSTADLDGDGQADVLIGLPGSDGSGTLQGVSYALDDDQLAAADAADSSTDGVISVSNIAAQTSSYTFTSSVDEIESGFQVASAGDVNNDGQEDLLIGQSNSVDATSPGVSYLINADDLAAADAADSSTDGSIALDNVTSVSGSASYKFIGASTFDRAGSAMSSAGDVDGDGLGDILIGASFTGSSQQGAVYLVTAADLEALDALDGSDDNEITLSQIANLTSGTSYIFNGVAGSVSGDRAGWSVSTAGDLDGDGQDDILIGAINSDDGNDSVGAVYVINADALASADAADGSTDQTISLANIAAQTNSYQIQGADASDELGWPVASAGNIIGTSADDLIIGARHADGGGGEAGETYLASLADLAAADAADGSSDGILNASLLCFGPGTLIATERGEVRVERLSIGDLVRTETGDLTPVTWIGRQTVVKQFAGERAQLVEIKAGALGTHTDLYVTGDHGMVVGGLVIIAAALVNGTTVSWVPVTDTPDRFTVYHVETEAHDVIFANGAPTETYLDVPGRRAFDNYQDYIDLYGPERVVPEMRRPRISSARLLPSAIKSALGLGQQTDAAGA